MGLRDEEAPQRDPAADAIAAPGALTALIARLARATTHGAPPRLGPGTRVGRYEIIRAIGHGGFGIVYEAHDTALNRLVALKVLHRQAADPAAAREAEVAARLAHPNIAALFDAGALDGGVGYLVYEILHGETLESRLARGPIPSADAVAIAAHVVRALSYAHAHGVVHRDLKPANVFLTAEGDVKVLDFGIALLFGAAAPGGGTPAYMAPEQRRGEAEDARTDLFALGLILREMLTGERGDAHGAANERVPLPVRRVLAELLADDPAARPRSARAALDELEAAGGALAAPRSRRRGYAIATATGLAVAVALGVGLLARERQRLPASAATGAAPSIAVLPFTDLSPEKDQEHFADGVAEEIRDALAHVEGLRVPGSASSLFFRGKDVRVEEIGRELGVGAVLEGSVRTTGNRVRITADIVSTSDGYRLWSETYERELTDIFRVQEEIAGAVVAALRVKLLPGETVAPNERRTSKPEAYNQYLIGRQFGRRQTVDGFRRAVESYEKALAIDPDYAPARAYLAYTLRQISSIDESADAAESFRSRALAEADRAVTLGPDLPEAYSIRGMLRMFWRRDWSGAEADFRRALALSPRDAPSQRRLGLLLATRGRVAEGLAAVERATELDPLDTTNWLWVGTLRAAGGRLDLAAAAQRRALEIVPETVDSHTELAIYALLDGRPNDALAEVEAIRKTSRLLVVAIAEHELGRAEASQRALDELIARHAHNDAYDIAAVHAWRGDRDRAFEWLERALDQELWSVKFDPLWRNLRGDPRWTDLLRKMQLPVD